MNIDFDYHGYPVGGTITTCEWCAADAFAGLGMVCSATSGACCQSSETFKNYDSMMSTAINSIDTAMDRKSSRSNVSGDFKCICRPCFLINISTMDAE